MDVHFVQQIDNSRVVRMDDPRRRREQQVLLGAVAVLFLLFFTFAWQRFQMVRLGYELQTVKQQQAQLRQANRTLQLQQAALASPGRITAVAASLGLQPAQPDQIVALDALPGAPLLAPVVASLSAPQPVAANRR